MTDMTPAPISVDRLRELQREMETACTWEAQRDFQAAALEALPALLHQLAERDAGNAALNAVCAATESKLAERDAEVERLRRECDLRKHAVDRWMPCPDHRDKVDGRCQVCAKEAAERAREEATGLLLEWADDAEANGYAASEYPLVARTRAFLAASGGGGHVSPAGAPTAQQPLDESANNAGVATGSRNDSASESVTRGSLPASDSICDALTAEWQAMGLYDATPASGGERE